SRARADASTNAIVRRNARALIIRLLRPLCPREIRPPGTAVGSSSLPLGRVRIGAVLQCRAVELAKERLACRRQAPLEPATWQKPAGASLLCKALDQRVPRLERAHDRTETDFARWPGQTDAAGSATSCRDEAVPGELAHGLHEMIARNGELLGDFRHSEAAL